MASRFRRVPYRRITPTRRVPYRPAPPAAPPPPVAAPPPPVTPVDPYDMPLNVSVRATSPIPLYYGDEDGVVRIPCTRSNPVKYGMGFSISVGPGAEEEYSTIVAPYVDKPEQKEVPFTSELTRSPAHLRGIYTGNVVVNGGDGIIHVYLCDCSRVCTLR